MLSLLCTLTFGGFSGQHIFHQFRQQFFFLPTFFLWRQTIYFIFFLPPPPLISNGASLSDLHINYKETLCVIPAARAWALLWKDRVVILHVDNITAKSVINKGTSRNSLVMHALGELFWLPAIYNFHIKADYVPGSDNIVADAISRVASPGGLDMLASVLGNSCNPMSLYCLIAHLPGCMSQESVFIIFSQINKLFSWSNNWIRRLLLTKCLPSPAQLRRHTIHTEIKPLR